MKQHLKKHSVLYFSWLIFLLPFLITRLPFFLHYPVVHFNPDDGGYYQIVDQMNKGFWPHLSIRPIGYPLFLKLVFTFCDRNFAVVAVQHFLTLVSCLIFIFVFYRVYRKHRFIPCFTALALGIFVSSGIHLYCDSSLMTDSLFVNLILLALSGLFFGLVRRLAWPLLLSSLAMAFSILVRPAGVFLFAVYLLVLLFVLINHFARRMVLAFVIPFPVLLLAIGLYNRLTIHTFSISTFTEHALISFTTTFLEKDDSLSPVANEAVERCRRAVDLGLLRNASHTWDFNEIRAVMERYYENNRIIVAQTFFDHESPDAYDLYLKWRPVWRKMGLLAIRSHPRIAVRYLYAVFMTYFYTNSFYDIDFYQVVRADYAASPFLRERFSGFGVPDSFFNRRFNTREYAQTLSQDFVRFMLKEYYQPLTFSHIRTLPGGALELRPTFWLKLHLRYQAIHNVLFRHILWIVVFAAAFILALIRIFATKWRHSGAFFSFLLTFSALAYGIFVTISAFPYLRYGYAMEYVYYMSPFLWCLAWRPDTIEERR